MLTPLFFLLISVNAAIFPVNAFLPTQTRRSSRDVPG